MITLTFSENDLRVIDQALGELPYRIAAPVVAEVNRQLEDQRVSAAYGSTPPPPSVEEGT